MFFSVERSHWIRCLPLDFEQCQKDYNLLWAQTMPSSKGIWFHFKPPGAILEPMALGVLDLGSVQLFFFFPNHSRTITYSPTSEQSLFVKCTHPQPESGDSSSYTLHQIPAAHWSSCANLETLVYFPWIWSSWGNAVGWANTDSTCVAELQEGLSHSGMALWAMGAASACKCKIKLLRKEGMASTPDFMEILWWRKCCQKYLESNEFLK